MSKLEDTIRVEFNGSGAEVEHVAIANVDDVLNVNSDGSEKTSFGSGESVYITLHLSSNISLSAIRLTHPDATIELVESATRTLKEQWFFTGIALGNETVHTTSVVPSSIGLNFFGNTGSPSQTTQEVGVVEVKANDFSNVPYIADVSIQYTVVVYKLTLPEVTLIDDDDSYPVGVVFYVEES